MKYRLNVTGHDSFLGVQAYVSDTDAIQWGYAVKKLLHLREMLALTKLILGVD
jgi:hypothetical protein